MMPPVGRGMDSPHPVACSVPNPSEQGVVCTLRFDHAGAHEAGDKGSYFFSRWGTLEERLYSIEHDIREIYRTLEEHRL